MKSKFYPRPTGLGILCLVLSFVLLHPLARAQAMERGEPASFQSPVLKTADVNAVQTPALDRDQLEAEDLVNDEEGGDWRFAVEQPLGVDLLEAGTHETLPNGDQLWRLRIKCEDALSIYLLIEELWIPKGGKLYVYSPDRMQVKGPYTHEVNQGTKENPMKYATGTIEGEEMVVEYVQEKGVEQNIVMTIRSAMHGYRAPSGTSVIDGGRYGDALGCMTNVNCVQGLDWQDEKRGVAKIFKVVNGWGFVSSGTLINNTDRDGRLLFLTADHNIGALDAEGDTDAGLWKFIWDFESDGCLNNNPGVVETVGASVIANGDSTDFALLCLIEDPRDLGIKVYFNGWSRSNLPPRGGVGIHHPKGDIKKISLHDSVPNAGGWNGMLPPDSHWWIGWDLTEGVGAVQKGSSGSPLFDPNGHIIGQLHGGIGTCTSATANSGYGRIDKSWEGYHLPGTPTRRLKDHLDPGNLDLMSLDGEYIVETPTACSQSISLFPYHQNFDLIGPPCNTYSFCIGNGACNLGDGWVNSSADHSDWLLRNDATPSSNTGPSNSPTVSGGMTTFGNYLYTEATGCTANESDLLSPCFDLVAAKGATMTFRYHMFGVQMGTMSVQASIDGGANWSGDLWSKSGHQGSGWKQASIDLSNYTGHHVKLRIRGKVGIETSDMAIDDFSILTYSENCAAVDFSQTAVLPFGSQDNGSYTVQDGGRTLLIEDNAWKKIALPANYQVTPNTLLQFDFRSTEEGEVHGIRFDNNDTPDWGTYSFKLHGTQGWGIRDFDNYAPLQWHTYVIPVGEYYTGTFDRLVFVCDKDNGAPTSNAYFRDVKFYEGGSCKRGNEAAAVEALEAEPEWDFSVAPNPFENWLEIRLPEMEKENKPASIVLYNLMGEVVFRKEHAMGQVIRIEPKLPAGVYMVQVQAGSWRADKKVIRMN